MQPFERLELEWAKFNDLDPAGMVACSSGTAALHLAVEVTTKDIRRCGGGDVLVPDYNMIACPRAVTLAGRTPVFCDCDPVRLLPTADEVRRYGNGRCHSVILPALYGRKIGDDVFDVAGDWCDAVIEDLAEAHGVRPHDGTDAACWSFYKNKIVAGEEGGAVWFRNPDHAKYARMLRTLGFTDAHDYTHIPRGHNYRMSNLHAREILEGYNGLHDYERLVGLRREIESWYELECPVEWRMPRRDAVWVYDLRIPGMTTEKQREVVEELRWGGIAARYGFKPCRKQEEYRNGEGSDGEWESDRASREVIYLPVQPGVTTRDDARRTFEIIRRTLAPR